MRVLRRSTSEDRLGSRARKIIRSQRDDHQAAHRPLRKARLMRAYQLAHLPERALSEHLAALNTNFTVLGAH